MSTRTWWWRDGSARLRVGAAVVSGLILSAAYPPLDLGPLALVALAPLFWTWRDTRPRRAALYAFVFALTFYGILLSWIRYFGWVAYLPLITAGGVYMVATAGLVVALGRRGVRSPFLIAAAWVFFEQMHGRFPFGGLPWGDLGAALHDVRMARSLASWGGVALVSFLVAACNAFVADAVVAFTTRAGPRLRVMAASGLAGLVAMAAVAHVARFEPRNAGSLHVALLQGNDKNRDLTPEEIAARYLDETHFGLADTLEGPFDLIVFPESALDSDPQTDPGLADRIARLAEEHDSAVLVNALVPAPHGRDYNTNLLYDPDGSLQGTYAKRHLVPFGEYVPLRDQLEFLDELDQIPYDYEPGKGQRIFTVAGHPIGTIICFESAFGALVRDYVHGGAEAIVVTTNNRSYRRSANSAQHVALSQMRAAETGRPVVHASISGITAIIDADGDIHDTTELFVNQVVVDDVTTTTGETPYVRYGDWVIWGSGLALVGAAAVARRRPGPGQRATPS